MATSRSTGFKVTAAIWNAVLTSINDAGTVWAGAVNGTTGAFSGAMAIGGASLPTAGIKFAAVTPAIVTSALYSPDGSAIYFNGSLLATGASVSGTTGKIGKFTGASSIGDSIIVESGTAITVAGTVSASGTGNNTFGGVSAGDINIGGTDIFDARLDVYNESLTKPNIGAYSNVAMTQPMVRIWQDNAAAVSNTLTIQNDGSGMGIGFVNDGLINAAANLRLFTNGIEAARIFTSRGMSIGDSTDPGVANLRVAGVVYLIGAAGVTTNALENRSGSLYFNNVALATGSSVSGTTGTIAKFTGSSTIGNSIMTEASTTVTVAGTMAATTFSGSGASLTAVPAGQLSGTITSGTQDLITRTGTITSGVWNAGAVTSSGSITSNGGHVILPATNNLFLDGGSNTYLQESSADVIGIFTGGARRINIAAGVSIGDTTDPGATNFRVTGDAKFGTTSNFSWVSKSIDTVYQAASDGFVIARADTTASTGVVIGMTDASNPPTTSRGVGSIAVNASTTITFPVKKGDYYKVTTTGASSTVWWVPLGFNG